MDTKNYTVTVNLSTTVKGMTGQSLFPRGGKLDTSAVAKAQGNVKLCALALDGSAEKAVSLNINAKLKAPGCSIYANSSATDAVYIHGASQVEATTVCSSGGVDGQETAFSSDPVTDCPVYEDPLASFAGPSIQPGCTYNNYSVGLFDLSEVLDAALNGLAGDGHYTDYSISPGVYCGGIKVGLNANVTFEPGIYVLKDGGLYVNAYGKITGTGVGIYLTGTDAKFNFVPESVISLSAPTSGEMAGILIMEDRNGTSGTVHQINSDDARNLLGTIYLPISTLSVASLFPIADQSDYTVIVANKLAMTGSPTLVLNSDYASSNVPVPAGVGPYGGQVSLVKGGRTGSGNDNNQYEDD